MSTVVHVVRFSRQGDIENEVRKEAWVEKKGQILEKAESFRSKDKSVWQKDGTLKACFCHGWLTLLEMSC